MEGGVVGKQSRSVYYTPSARRVVYYSLQMKPRIQIKLGLKYTEKRYEFTMCNFCVCVKFYSVKQKNQLILY